MKIRMSPRSRWTYVAALAAALAMLAAFNLQQLTPKHEQLTTTQPLTVSSATSIIRQASTLYGKIFFDYNGNGKQETGEPDVPNVTVAFDGKNTTVTNSTGWYVIDDVTHGTRLLKVFPPGNFRYMCESGAELRKTTGRYAIRFTNHTRKDIGLMEGFLTLPFPSTKMPHIARYYDWNPSIRNYVWWNGRSSMDWPQNGTDNHTGVDYDLEEGSPVLATAPGIVVSVRKGRVEIEHDDGFVIHYCHVRQAHVSEGDIVSRGQLIAESGNIPDDDCTSTYPHLHIQIVMTYRDMWILLDPYSPVFPLSSENSGYWAYRKNVLSWYRSPVDMSPNVLGYWTKRNDPRYSQQPIHDQTQPTSYDVLKCCVNASMWPASGKIVVKPARAEHMLLRRTPK